MLAGKIIGWWVLLSVTLGPCLTWLLFYLERRDTRDRDVPTGDPAQIGELPKRGVLVNAASGYLEWVKRRDR